jgi:hypothetical protein
MWCCVIAPKPFMTPGTSMDRDIRPYFSVQRTAACGPGQGVCRRGHHDYLASDRSG